MSRHLLFKPSLVVVPYFLLLGLGVVEVWSSSYYFAYSKFGDPNFFLRKELVFALASLFFAFACSFIDYRIYKRISLVLVAAALFMLVLLHFDGVNIRGAVRWLDIGGVLFEPSGFAEIALLIYIADFISRKHRYKDDIGRGILPVAFIVGLFFMLIALEPDVGTALLIGLVFLVMIYVFGYSVKHILTLLFPLLLVAGLIVYTYPQKLKRVVNFFITGHVNYQVERALIALGGGGFFGSGPAKGIYKSLFVPDSYNDFIVAGIGEDFGFLGVFLSLCLLILILLATFSIAKNCKDTFGKALTSGIGFLLSFQALMNLYSVLHLMPPKGITMPFLSYGGTNLIVDGILIGIVLSVYRYG